MIPRIHFACASLFSTFRRYSPNFRQAMSVLLIVAMVSSSISLMLWPSPRAAAQGQSKGPKGKNSDKRVGNLPDVSFIRTNRPPKTKGGFRQVAAIVPQPGTDKLAESSSWRGWFSNLLNRALGSKPERHAGMSTSLREPKSLPVPAPTLPPSAYSDPSPAADSSGAKYNGYYTAETKIGNLVGDSDGTLFHPTSVSGADNGGSNDSAVSLASQNFSFSVPVLSLPGRNGLNLNLTLYYNSKAVWTLDSANNKIFFNADKGSPAPGFSLGFGYILGSYKTGTTSAAYYNNDRGKDAYLFVAPDGSRHELLKVSGQTYHDSYDSTYMRYEPSTRTLTLMDGTVIIFDAAPSGSNVFLPNMIRDRNGNHIDITNATISNDDSVTSNGIKAISQIKDTAGRIIEFRYNSNRLTSIRQDRNPGGTPNYYTFASFDYDKVTVSHTFNTSTLTVDPAMSSTDVYVPISVTFPNLSYTKFYYTSYAQMYLYETWAPTISGQGTTWMIAYTKYNLPSATSSSWPAHASPDPVNYSTSTLTDSPGFTTRKELAAFWNLDVNGNPQEATTTYDFQSGYTKITDPLGRIARMDFNTSGTYNGLVTTQKIFDTSGNYPSSPKKTLTYGYGSDSGPSYLSNPRLASLVMVDSDSNARGHSFSYNTTNVSGVALLENEDDWLCDGSTTCTASTTSPTIYRRTKHYWIDTTNYSAYTNRHIYNLQIKVEQYIGAGTQLVARTELGYDGSSYFTNSSSDGVIMWDSSNPTGSSDAGRGNLTTVKQYEVDGSGTVGSNRYVKRITYDSQGTVRSVKDANDHEVDFDPWDNYLNKPSGTGETRTTSRGVKDGDGYWNGANYDWFTGEVLNSYHIAGTSVTGTPENVTAYGYDNADRLIWANPPQGGSHQIDYWDNWMVVATFDLVDSSFSTYQYQFYVYDGAGRLRSQGAYHPDADTSKFGGQKFVIDTVGRTAQVSNKIAMNGSWVAIDDDDINNGGWGWAYTVSQFDYNDRTTQRTNPDTSYMTLGYTGCGCAGSQSVTVTDERGKKSKQVYDFLGRLKEAQELTSASTPALYNKAVYTYDVRDLTTAIDTYNNSTAYQTRSFTYDGYSRQQTVVTPEGGTVTYNWNDDDTLNYKEDERLVPSTTTKYRTTYTYNGRHLTTQKAYNDYVTSNIAYTYGEYGERTLMQEKDHSNNVLSSTTYSYDSYKRLQTETRAFNGLSGTYSLGYTYNYQNQIKSITYTAKTWSKAVNYVYNFTGALASVGTTMTSGTNTTNVISGLNYRGWGALKLSTLGNTLKEERDYDPTRQQMVGLRVKKQDNSATIMNYDYDFANGGNNNGRIQKVTDHVNSAWTTTYTYDDYNRLTSAVASSGSGNPTYTRNYTYDAWGNMLTISNGTNDQIQGEKANYTMSYAQNASGAPSTNQINNSGYSYDAAGNMTNDDLAYLYIYDVESRPYLYQGHLTYYYDGDGRRDKVDDSNTTDTYYLYSSYFSMPMLELSSSGTVNRANIPGKDPNTPLAFIGTDGNFYWAHTDYLGSLRHYTNTSGTDSYRLEYDPFGQIMYPTSPAPLSPQGFTGYARESSGLDNANARTYRQAAGRMMQADPLGVKAASKNSPQSLNRYSYVGNDPINFTDPSGLCRFGIIIINRSGLGNNSMEMNALRAEIQRIYAAAGHQVVFNMGGDSTFIFAIQAQSGSNPNAPGWTPIDRLTGTAGAVGHGSTDVLQAGIEGTIGVGPMPSQADVMMGRNPVNFGRAMGRVAAHEMGHHLLGHRSNNDHTPGTVMQAGFRGASWWNQTFSATWQFNAAQRAVLDSQCQLPFTNHEVASSIGSGGGGGDGGGGGGGDPFDGFRWLEFLYNYYKSLEGDSGDHLA